MSEEERLELARRVDDRAQAMNLNREEIASIISFFAGFAPDDLADLLDGFEHDRRDLAALNSGSSP